MKPPRISVPLLVFALLAVAGAARAQGPTATVLPRGMLGFRVMGHYTQWDERFDGGRQPFGAAFQSQLQGLADSLTRSFAPTIADSLTRFYDFTQETTGGERPTELGFGTTVADVAADIRTIPFTLEYGFTPRITLGVTLPIERRGTSVQGIFLTEGTLGLNPEPDANGDVLAQVDPTLRRIGELAFLPVAGSPAAEELARRVAEYTDDPLVFPTRGANFGEILAEGGTLLSDAEEAALALQSDRSEYGFGDLELSARFLVASSAPGWPLPDTAAESGFRATVGARLRLPTGVKSNTHFLLEIPPGTGHFGVGGDAVADWFVSRRWWVSGAASVDVLFPTDVERLAFSAEEPFPDTLSRVTLTREPGVRVGASLTPRYRLTREFTFAGQYEALFVGETSYSGGEGDIVLGPIETTDSWMAHRFGLGASYSTTQAYRLGEAPFPFDVSLMYRNTFAGSGFAPAAGIITLSAQVYYPLFGRPRRERADSVQVLPPPADTSGAEIARPDTVPAPTPERPSPTPPQPAPPLARSPWFESPLYRPRQPNGN